MRTTGLSLIKYGSSETIPLRYNIFDYELEAEIEKVDGIRDVSVTQVRNESAGHRSWQITFESFPGEGPI